MPSQIPFLSSETIEGVMWKTTSTNCNLACQYCYYKNEEGGHVANKQEKIDVKLLERFIFEYMSTPKECYNFIWQGGEPLLAGLDFFKKVVEIQNKYLPNGCVVNNSLQTNGTLINRRWASFFKKNHFLLGVSLDGPKKIHDTLRPYPRGQGSYDNVMRGIDYLLNEYVDFNILTVLHQENIHAFTTLFEFYKLNNFSYIQFIPGMDFQAVCSTNEPSYLITPEQYADFLSQSFDVWFNQGHPYFSIRFFDNLLLQYLGYGAESCTEQKTCPKNLVILPNGDVYPCDFYLDNSERVGSLNNNTLDELTTRLNKSVFFQYKQRLSLKCQTCRWVSLCHGGCPRGRRREHYFCKSYQTIYQYADERMRYLAQKIHLEQPS